MAEKLNPVKAIRIDKNIKASDIVENMRHTAFNARKLGLAAEIWLQACQEKDCKKFLGLAGALVPGGMKQILIDMIEKETIDVLVSTGANLTHDIIEALGFSHYQGSSEVNDSELKKHGLDRIYNVFMQNKVYQVLEKWCIVHFDEINAETNSEFLFKVGKILNESEKGKNSILAACFRKNIPIFCPALSDSGIGLMIWSMMTRKKIPAMKEFNDLNKMLDIAWTSKKKAIFYIGGGVPKNYIQQAMQFSSPAIYGVQIKVDDASFGGSSGAPLKEGISWGKMSEKGRFIDVNCDATIALPLIYSFLIEKI